jgi:hypothetical protein
MLRDGHQGLQAGSDAAGAERLRVRARDRKSRRYGVFGLNRSLPADPSAPDSAPWLSEPSSGNSGA